MKPRLRSSDGLISGAAAVRWRWAKAAKKTAPAARAATGAAVHPSVDPWIRPNSRPSMHAASSAEPGASMLTARSPTSRGSSLSPAASPAAPSTMLIRNMGRQPSPNRLASISRPASSGPPTADSPRTGPKALNALPMCSRGKTEPSMPKPCGISSAPNAPWTSRATMIEGGSQARPQASEAAVKPARPIRKVRRRPYLSPSRPPVTSSTPRASA